MGEWEKLIMTVNLFGTPEPLPHPSTACCGCVGKGGGGKGKGKGGNERLGWEGRGRECRVKMGREREGIGLDEMG